MAAAASRGHGYEQDALLSVIEAKTRRYRDALADGPLTVTATDAQLAIGLLLGGPTNSLRVLDFGGACGAHCAAARVLLRGVALRWCVVETSAMAAQARGLEDGALSFHDTLGDAVAQLVRTDVVLSAGTLQYLPDPYATLASLVAVGARTLVLTRLALTDGPTELYSVQESAFSDNGPGPLPPGMQDGRARYPVVTARRERIEQVIASAYDIRARFSEDGGIVGYLATAAGAP
jgi:putative methyltransferase (TIGR04325 family)